MSDKELAQWHLKRTQPHEQLTHALQGKVVTAARMDRPDGNQEEVVLEFDDGSVLILHARTSGSGPCLYNRVCEDTEQAERLDRQRARRGDDRPRT